jgi:hypothetical protein
MLRISTKFTLVVTAIFLAACSTRTFCQATTWERVPNLPYTAQVVETLDDGQIRRETKMFQARDSQGRTRIEMFSDSPCNRHTDQPVMVNLFVPLRRQFIQLIPAQKTARVMTFPGAGPIPTLGPNANAVKTTTENLQGQLIHRIYAVGKRTTQLIPSDDGRSPNIVDIEETWVSPHLKIVVLYRHWSTDSRSGNTIREVRQVDRSEPEAALFEVPADYNILPVTTEPQSSSTGKLAERSR